MLGAVALSPGLGRGRDAAPATEVDQGKDPRWAVAVVEVFTSDSGLAEPSSRRGRGIDSRGGGWRDRR